MKRFLFSLLALFAFAVPVFAQNTGQLNGTVLSPDGGVIPGASVTIIDKATQKERTVVASGEGTFGVPSLEAGLYTVRITSAGFKTFTATDVKIDVGRPYTLNATLEPGNINEEVTVTAGADVINSTTGELSNTVAPRQIQELPLNGRNPLGLITLQAGTSSNGATNTAINGQRTSFTNITRDGINIQDNFIRANATDFSPQRPGVDDISEFTLTSSNADASQGYGASQVQVQTERGRSDYHGALFAYNRNSKFSSQTFFNNAAGEFGPNDDAVIRGLAQVGDPRVRKPFLNRNQFGGKIGGPMPLPRFGEGGASTWRDKGFFFFNYEKFLEHRQATTNKTILLPSARTGVFTYIDNTGATRSINLLTAFGSRFGVTGVNPAVQSRVLDLIPTQGNNSDVGDQRNTTGFRTNVQQNTERDNYTMRFDVDANAKNAFNFIYAYGTETNDRPDIATGYTPAPLVVQPAIRHFLSTGWRWTPNSTFSNEVRGGFFTSEPIFERVQELGDIMLVPGLVSNPETTFLDQGRKSENYTIADDASFLTGNHTLRFGGNRTFFTTDTFAHFTTTPQFSLQLNTATGQLAAADFAGGISNAQLASANALMALLGGIVGRVDQTFNATTPESGFVPGAPARQVFDYEHYGFYFNDQWRVKPSLTLNLGLRYDLFTPLRERNGFALEPVIGDRDPVEALLDPNGTIDFIGNNASGNEFYNIDKNNFGPIISFAWSPQFKNNFLGSIFGGEGRSVIRGGYRISYVNDEFVRGPDNAQAGNAGLTNARAFLLNGRLGSPLPVIPTGSFTIPRSFAAGNTLSGINFGTIFAIDPNIKTPMTQEWNIGIQRELGFQTAIEIRYVGGKSDNAIRGVDLNELDIFDNGFLAGYNVASNNARLAAARNAAEAAAGVPVAQRTPVNGLFNANVPGSQSLAGTVFGNNAAGQPILPGNGFLTNATVVNALLGGTPAGLANSYVQAAVSAANAPLFSQFFSPNPNAGAVDLLGNGGFYRYHSLQVELRRRFAQGFHLQANYTFQKTLTNASGVGQTKFEPNLSNLFPEIEYSRADYDTAHVFNLNTIYELPFGRGKRWADSGGVSDRLLGGWQVTSIVQISTGAPITITDARSTLTRRNGRQTPDTNLTKDQIKDLVGIFRTPCGVFWINPAVININQQNLANGNCGALGSGRAAEGFGQPTFNGQVFFNVNPGRTGTLERAFLNGPLYLNWDASLIKNFRLTEESRIQLRLEAFNLLNRTNFFVGNFGNSDINGTNFGRITSTFTSSGANRVLQGAIRFEF